LLFAGQGSQYVDMGRGLYETQPVFRAAVERCAEGFQPFLERSLLSILYPDASQRAEALALIDDIAYAQPALFAIQYGLTRLWRSCGIEPVVVAGHSVGEYAAACTAGVFGLDDALKLVAARSRLLQSLPRSAMAAVFAPEAEVARALWRSESGAAIAAVNGPECVVIAGPSDAVRAAVAELGLSDERWRLLNLPAACHSPMVEPILDAFTRVAAEVSYFPPRVPMVSTVFGQLASASDLATSDYWRRHLRAPVRFAAAMETLWERECDAFVEIGPQTTLLDMGQRCVDDERGAWLPSLRQGHDDLEQFLDSLRQLEWLGAPVSWPRTGRGCPHGETASPLRGRGGERHAADPWHEPRSPTELRQALAEAPVSERRARLVDYVRGQVAQLLGLDAVQGVPPDARLRDLGLDSLMTVALRDRLSSGLGLRQRLPATLALDYPSCAAIGGFLEASLARESEATALTTVTESRLGASPAVKDRGEEIDDLSDEEVERLLLRRLNSQ
jgi:acyl transferase domain-containing protein